MNWATETLDFFNLFGIWPTEIFTEEELNFLGSMIVIPKYFGNLDTREIKSLEKRKTNSRITSFLYENPPLDEFEKLEEDEEF